MNLSLVKLFPEASRAKHIYELNINFSDVDYEGTWGQGQDLGVMPQGSSYHLVVMKSGRTHSFPVVPEEGERLRKEIEASKDEDAGLTGVQILGKIRDAYNELESCRADRKKEMNKQSDMSPNEERVLIPAPALIIIPAGIEMTEAPVKQPEPEKSPELLEIDAREAKATQYLVSRSKKFGCTSKIAL